MVVATAAAARATPSTCNVAHLDSRLRVAVRGQPFHVNVHGQPELVVMVVVVVRVVHAARVLGQPFAQGQGLLLFAQRL